MLYHIIYRIVSYIISYRIVSYYISYIIELPGDDKTDRNVSQLRQIVKSVILTLVHLPFLQC